MRVIAKATGIALALLLGLVLSLGAVRSGPGVVVTLQENAVITTTTQTTRFDTEGGSVYALMRGYDQGCAFIQSAGAAVTATVQTGLADEIWFDAYRAVEDETNGQFVEVALRKALSAGEDDYLCFPMDGSVMRLSFAPAGAVTLTSKVYLKQTMATWQQMRTNVRTVIKDTNGTKVGDGELLAYVNYALDWVARRHPLLRSATVVLIDREGTLPDDCVLVTHVYSDTVELEEEVSFFPATDEYTVYADRILKMGDADLADVRIVYHAMYDAVVDDTDEIPVPRWLEEAVFCYVVSRGLAQRASDVSTINQWDGKNDSGNPEHNPLLRVAEYYEELAERALNRPGGH